MHFSRIEIITIPDKAYNQPQNYSTDIDGLPNANLQFDI
jgi:hypothetical protein